MTRGHTGVEHTCGRQRAPGIQYTQHEDSPSVRGGGGGGSRGGEEEERRR